MKSLMKKTVSLEGASSLCGRGHLAALVARSRINGSIPSNGTKQQTQCPSTETTTVATILKQKQLNKLVNDSVQKLWLEFTSTLKYFLSRAQKVP